MYSATNHMFSYWCGPKIAEILHLFRLVISLRLIHKLYVLTQYCARTLNCAHVHSQVANTETLSIWDFDKLSLDQQRPNSNACRGGGENEGNGARGSGIDGHPELLYETHKEDFDDEQVHVPLLYVQRCQLLIRRGGGAGGGGGGG